MIDVLLPIAARTVHPGHQAADREEAVDESVTGVARRPVLFPT
jgi:hypothetical protein